MTKFLDELLEQPKALCQTAGFLDSEAGKTAIGVAKNTLKSARRVVAIGMGSSYFLADALSVMMASRGFALDALNSGELLHYGLNSIDGDTVIVAISQSGESFETVRAIKMLDKRGCHNHVIAITNEADSTLAHRADTLLTTCAGLEEKTSGKTFITAYQIIYTLVEAVIGKGVSNSTWSEIAKDVNCLLNSRTQIVPRMLEVLGNAPYLQFIARGTTMASAKQSALMTMEASHTPAQALSGGEFRHGPLEMVGRGFAAVLFAPTCASTFPQLAKLTDDILAYDGRVLLVTDNTSLTMESIANVNKSSNLVVVEVPAQTEELFAITALIPIQIAIESWARSEKGIEPGIFTHGGKVTSVE